MSKTNVLFDVIKAIKDCSSDGETVSNPFFHFSKGDDVTEVWEWLAKKIPDASVDKLLQGEIPVYKVLEGPVKTALDHIEEVFDCPANVHFTDSLYWDYTNQETGKSFDFDDMEDDIHNETLEEAARSVKVFPSYFFL